MKNTMVTLILMISGAARVRLFFVVFHPDKNILIEKFGVVTLLYLTGYGHRDLENTPECLYGAERGC